MFKKYHSFFFVAQDWYRTLKKELQLLSQIRIENKLLSQELERACTKSHGVLTYAEYLSIIQFGENGYYATSKHHGKTDIEKRWGEALAIYCQKFGYDTVIEFGCGTGELGVQTAKAYKREMDKTLHWIGVEIDISIHKKILSNFTSAHEEDAIEKITTSLDKLPSRSNVLIVFPYSLDNIPPYIFLNTKPALSYPNALLGIKVKNGLLSEVIISQETLQKKGLQLINGIFTEKGISCELTSWKLYTGQRAYISTHAFSTLYHYARKFGSDSSVIIIDELRNDPWFFYLGNLGTPKSLYEKNLVCNDKKRYYRQSGKHNLYYPLYTNGLLSFLHAIGFQSVDYEIEQKKAAQLRGKQWIRRWDKYSTFVYIAKNFVHKKMPFYQSPISHKGFFNYTNYSSLVLPLAILYTYFGYYL